MPESELSPIGTTLDNLGVRANIDDGDLIASAVVILSILEPDDSTPRLCIANSENLSWIEQAGMMRLAERIMSTTPTEDGE